MYKSNEEHFFKRMYREDRSPPGIGHGDRLHDEDAVFAQHVLHRAEEGAQVIVSDGLDHLAADDAIEGDPWQATKTGKYLSNITSTCHIRLIFEHTSLAAALCEDSVVHQLEGHQVLQALLPNPRLGQRLLLGGESDARDSASIFLSRSYADAAPPEANIQQSVRGVQRLEAREQIVDFPGLCVFQSACESDFTAAIRTGQRLRLENSAAVHQVLLVQKCFKKIVRQIVMLCRGMKDEIITTNIGSEAEEKSLTYRVDVGPGVRDGVVQREAIPEPVHHRADPSSGEPIHIEAALRAAALGNVIDKKL